MLTRLLPIADLEVVQARTVALSQVAQEKAALEKRVHGLTMELQRAQMELEKEKENKAIAEPAKAGASKIARPVRLPFLLFAAALC
jgi:hypothetical protein